MTSSAVPNGHPNPLFVYFEFAGVVVTHASSSRALIFLPAKSTKGETRVVQLVKKSSLGPIKPPAEGIIPCEPFVRKRELNGLLEQ